MKYLGISILIGLIVGNVFSFGFMNHRGGEMTSDCIPSYLNGASCEQIGLATAIHHINAYHVFSTAFLPMAIVLILTLILLGLGFLFLKYPFRKNLFAPDYKWERYKRTHPELPFYGLRRITSWLSLFENSPSLR